MNIPEPLNQIIEEVKKREKEQKEFPALAARDIYENKGAQFLYGAVNHLICCYVRHLKLKKHPTIESISDIEWGKKFIEEGFNILGVKDAANLASRDMVKAISIWHKYGVEQANGNN